MRVMKSASMPLWKTCGTARRRSASRCPKRTSASRRLASSTSSRLPSNFSKGACMSWKVIHRWLGLTVGTLAVVLGITGSVLAIDPVQQAWQAPVAPGDLPVAMLVERVTRSVPGVEEIRRLPSVAIVVFSFAGDQPQAQYVDPADGRVLGAWRSE